MSSGRGGGLQAGAAGWVRRAAAGSLALALGLSVAAAAPVVLAASAAAPVTISLSLLATVSAGEPIPVSATLTSGGAPVAHRLVRFYVDNSEVVGAISIANGQASTTIRAAIPARAHTIKATFAGGGGYAAATASAALTVEVSTLSVHVVPAVAGTVTLSIDGGPPLTPDREGYINTDLTVGGKRSLQISVHDPSPGIKTTFVAWSNHDTSPTRVIRVEHDTYTQVAIQVAYLTLIRFQDAQGQPLSAHKVTKVSIDGPDGVVDPVNDSKVWLSSPVPHLTSSGALAVGPDFYSLRTADYDGINVAKQGEDRVIPGILTTWTARLGVYPLTLYARDMLFGSQASGPALLTGPDGLVRQVNISPRDGSTVLLPGALYKIKFKGLGFSPSAKVRVSSEQSVPIKVFTVVDGLVLLLLVLVAALGLLAVSRWRSQLLSRLHVWSAALRSRPGSDP